MDDRQRGIVEGAGLDESRLNREFLDWLNRWGGRILTLCLVVLALYAGWNWWGKLKVNKVNKAFREFQQASDSGASPESLKAIADTYSGVRAIPEMARLAAADSYLEAALRGLLPGAQLSPEGVPVSDADELTPDERQWHLDQAEALYRQVLTATESNPDRLIHAVGAAFGLAAVADTRGDADTARSMLEQAAALAERAGLPPLAEQARKRIDLLGSASSVSALLHESDLPPPPEPEIPELSPDETPVESPVEQPVLGPDVAPNVDPTANPDESAGDPGAQPEDTPAPPTGDDPSPGNPPQTDPTPPPGD
ncbi:MAG: tetratricopeptide repeat protein [Phycisphaeraceae bacterium]|nr:tetratricopeptide repeat protein [Phycisphaeraceae bacterium]